MINNLIPVNSPIFELSNKLGELLKLEFNNQLNLANTLGVNPFPYDIRVFTESSLPIDSILRKPESEGAVDRRSCVTVRFDSANLDTIQSNQHYQLYACQYHIDVLGIGIAKPNGAGQSFSEKEANDNLFNTFTLVEKIVTANQNVRLGYNESDCPIQLNCKIKNFEVYSVDQDERSTVALQAGRISFETTCQVKALTGETGTFEQANIKVVSSENGELLVELDTPTN